MITVTNAVTRLHVVPGATAALNPGSWNIRYTMALASSSARVAAWLSSQASTC